MLMINVKITEWKNKVFESQYLCLHLYNSPHKSIKRSYAKKKKPCMLKQFSLEQEQEIKAIN